MAASDIAIPARLAQRPRDSRGYPVPATVVVGSDGRPDFRVTDIERWLKVVKNRTCALCAEPLGRYKAFVGGPLCHENRLFTDLPMHEDCAVYALQVCPFLAAPSFRYAQALEAPAGFAVAGSAHVQDRRPEKFFLGIALGYVPLQLPDSTLVVQATTWLRVQWWQQGKLLA